MGYEIILVFVHLDNVSLNQARVSQRVSEGGHYAPDDKVISRIPRVLQNIEKTLPLCTHCYLLDNSRLDSPFNQVAQISSNKLIRKAVWLPQWAENLLAEYLD